MLSIENFHNKIVKDKKIQENVEAILFPPPPSYEIAQDLKKTRRKLIYKTQTNIQGVGLNIS